MQEADQVLAEASRQLERMHRKVGSFTDGMAFPSMKRMLFDRFCVDHIGVRHLVRRGDRRLELDVLADSNDPAGAVYVVEVQSRLREDGLQQMLQILRDFPEFFPTHRDKHLYGILAVVDAPDDLARRVVEQGIYLARIRDDSFELDVPEGFEPRSFQETTHLA